MTDPVKAVKDAYYSLLKDAGLNYNGSAVTANVGAALKADGQYYLVISTAAMQNRPNKHVFTHEVTVDVDIYTKQQLKSENPFAAVDEIAQQVLSAVLPSVGSTGLDYGAAFQENEVRCETSNYDVMTENNVYLISRKVRFIQILTQL